MRAKTVIESISFERGMDPKEALGIGESIYKKHLIEMIPEGRPRLGRITCKHIIKTLESPEITVLFDKDYIIITGKLMLWSIASALVNRLNMYAWQVEYVSYDKNKKELVLKTI